MQDQLKTIIITARNLSLAKTSAVTVVSWYELTSSLNLKDFDKVILDLNQLERDKVDWAIFHDILTPEVVMAILQGRGSGIFIVGDVKFTYEYQIGGGAFTTSDNFLGWTGADFRWDEAPGNGITINPYYDGHILDGYGQYLKGYSYSLEGTNTQLSLKNKKLQIAPSTVFQTRYNTAITFNLDYFGPTASGQQAYPGDIMVFSQMQDKNGEIVRQILDDFCGGHITSPEPEWAMQITAPGQQEIDKAIDQQKTVIETARKAVAGLTDDRAQAREPVRLLYEQHKPLEEVVKDVFRRLGAEIVEPTKTNEEEFWVKAYGYEGVTEVKSTANAQVDKKGFMQLQGWVLNGEADGKSYKGILIINTAAGAAPDQRPDPVPDNLKTLAQKHGMAVITTAQVYEAYELVCAKELDAKTFWDKLFGTSGVFERQ